MKKNIFSKRSRINAPVEDVFSWHERPCAIERLCPPWDYLKIIDQTGGIAMGDKVVMEMKTGPIKYKWHADHTAFIKNMLFIDKQTKGPFASWIHTHQFESEGKASCILEDAIEYRFPMHPFFHVMFNTFVLNKLKRIFNYRHKTIADDIYVHLSYKDKSPKTILIAGASGLIGSCLVPFLTTGGHRVIKLVRREPLQGKDEVFWDPSAGILDPDDLNNIDAVINLAGDNIAQGRWTDEKKKRIIDSSVKGTLLLSETIAKLKYKPSVFICASAVGYYGNRDDTLLTEEDEAGDGFLASVCVDWEKSTSPASQAGIRTAFVRFGAVLSPRGGALAKMLFPFKMGFGGKIASGKQYLSWIAIDDVLGAVYHVIMNDSINGPVNLVSPNPLANVDFTRILCRAISKPMIFPLPAWVVKLMFGEMGNEALLSSIRVKPKKLLDTGYSFRFPHLKDALCHLLGINADKDI